MKPLVQVLIASAVTGLFAIGPLVAGTDEKGFIRTTPEEVQWKSPVGVGAKIANIYGDPTKPGLYVQRVTFPPRVFSRPHYHPQDRHVTVIKGTWYTGTGEEFNPDKAVPLKAGSYMFHPAKGVHWDGAKDEEVIVQIMGIGPADTIPVKPGPVIAPIP